MSLEEIEKDSNLFLTPQNFPPLASDCAFFCLCSVILLLALHLCLFTMIGMLLFAKTEVRSGLCGRTLLNTVLYCWHLCGRVCVCVCVCVCVWNYVFTCLWTCNDMFLWGKSDFWPQNSDQFSLESQVDICAKFKGISEISRSQRDGRDLFKNKDRLKNDTINKSQTALSQHKVSQWSRNEVANVY